MSDPLPARPDLDQLRRRAKELRDAVRRGDAAALARFTTHHPSGRADDAGLAAAQFVIARELGFVSWPALKAAVDAEVASRQLESAFLKASVEGRARRSAELLDAGRGLAERSVHAAAALGDVRAVGKALTGDPASAVAVDDARGWPPLLYACYSLWHEIDPDRIGRFTEVARLLLEAGASADTNDGGRPRFRSALRGAVETGKPDITEALLDAGAHPDPGQPVVEAVAHGDHRSVRLLLAHGARIAGTWVLGAAVFHDDPVAMTLLLDTLRARGEDVAAVASQHLPEAVAIASLPVVEALLAAGANPRAADEEGTSALRSAVRAGRRDIAARLLAGGAVDDATDVDRLLGAGLSADREGAQRLLGEHPDLRERLTARDRAAILEAAGARRPEALALMLDLGFPYDARDDSGQQPLHTAAYNGDTEAVRLLLDAGAEVDARDTTFDGTPLGFATVGSGEQAGKPGDWPGTVRLLLQAGASRHHAWVAGKPPSEEVAELLRGYGIGPVADQAADGATDAPPHPREVPSPDGGVISEIAEQLDAACRTTDLDLLASLLHPEVHWTGVCRTSAQVIDWYRYALAEGTTFTVDSLEVDRDAVVIGLTLMRPAEGARPAPPHRLYQVFTVEGAQIVDIRGYPDRLSALTRA